ncbi:MAG: membrane protein insertase YidC, partial [Xanthobacteraceae bacterium]
MNDHKNTILAFVLSLIVVVGWEYYFAKPEMQKQAQTQQEQTQPNGAQPATPAPGANAPAAPNAPAAQPANQTRAAVIAASPRVAIDTPRLHGSIDLKGGRIDDLSLEQYRETTDPNSPPIVLLSPSGAPDAYYAEFGWVAGSGASQALPGTDTVWKQDGSGALSIDRPVTLSYDNGQGLIFNRTISVDDHYLFQIKDQVQNKGSSPVTLYP